MPPLDVIIVGNNSLYVADYGDHRVQRFSTSIDPRFTANLPGTNSITVNYPCCPSYNEIVEIYPAAEEKPVDEAAQAKRLQARQRKVSDGMTGRNLW